MTRDPLERYLERRSTENFTRLLDETQEQLLGVAFRLLGDRGRAEDVVQEVYAKVMQKDWPPERIEHGRRFLVTTVVLTSRMRARTDARRQRREAEHAAPKATADLPREEIWDVRAAVAELPDPLRLLVELRYFVGLAVRDAAAAVGVSLRTAEARLRDARDALRRRLSPGASALVVPVLEGTHDPLWPPLPHPEALADAATEATNPFAPRLIRARRRGLRAVATAAALLLTAALGVSLLHDGGAADRAEPAGETRATPVREQAREVAVTAQAPSPSPSSAHPLLQHDREAAPAAAASPRAAATTGLRVEVVDPDGTLLRDGELRLEIPWWSYSAVAEAFEKNPRDVTGFQHLAEVPIDLARENPVVVEDIPDELAGIEFVAFACGPGLSPAEATIRMEMQTTTEVVLAPAPVRTLAVEVRGGDSGGPVSGARVLSVTELRKRRLDVAPQQIGDGPGRARTDGAGRALLTGLGPGAHTLEVHGDGFAAEQVEDVRPETTPAISIALEKAHSGSIEVVVYDPAGEVVPEVEVELSVAGQAVGRKATTGLDGRVVFDGLPEGDHSLSLMDKRWVEMFRGWTRSGAAHASERHASIYRVLWLEDGKRESVQLGYAAGTARIIGRVAASDGGPRAGIEVEMEFPFQETRESNASGKVEFGSLPGGIYRFRVGAWQVPAVTVAEGDVAAPEWTLGRCVVSGVVVKDADSTAMPGVSLTLEAADRADDPAAESRTQSRYLRLDSRRYATGESDAAGRFAFADVPPGRYRIIATTGWFHFESLELEVAPSDGSLEIEFRSKEPARMRIVFANPAGIQSADLRVRYWPADEPAAAIDLGAPDASSPATWLTVPLTPGRYLVEIETPDSPPQYRSVDVAERQTTLVGF